jgi:hypothetical protein
MPRRTCLEDLKVSGWRSPGFVGDIYTQQNFLAGIASARTVMVSLARFPGRVNAIFCLWQYWRSGVSTSSDRARFDLMLLSPLPLPY